MYEPTDRSAQIQRRSLVVMALGTTVLFLWMIWDFLLAHPFWLPAGASVYQQAMPATTPAWCALGKGGATPRPEDQTCPE